MTEQSLQELRLVARADVYKRGRLAATLTRSPSGVAFAYLAAWLEEQGAPIATSLPLRDEPRVSPGGAVPAFFTGLLPEGRRLGALLRQIKTSSDDELSLLLAVGSDAVGDVQVIPSGAAVDVASPRLSVRDFKEVSFTRLLAELGIKAERTALPGVQDKVSAAMLNVPVAQRGRRFILKLNPPEYPHLVENEHFFLTAARRSGIETAKATIVHDVDGESGLLVERFDRVPSSEGAPGEHERFQSLAVEDACQILDRPPGDKYLVGAEGALKALVDVCLAPLPAARVFLTQLVFAYVTANGDAHAKNFSVLQDIAGEWRPSPAYDLPSSHPYGDTTMALSIGGRISGDFGGGDFHDVGAHLGLRPTTVSKILRGLTARTAMWIDDLDQLPFDDRRKHKLRRVIEHRLRRLEQ